VGARTVACRSFYIAITAVALGTAAAAHDGEAFVFGSMVFDTGRKMAAFGPYRSQIADCSSQKALCLRTSFIQIVAPRRCNALKKGQELPGHGTTFEIIGAVIQGGHHLTPSPMYLIGDRSQRNTVLGYRPRDGIGQIIRYESRDALDIFSMLKAAEARGELKAAYDGLSRHILRRLTFAPLFKCPDYSPF
jgi:hypothetical protein